MITNRRDFLTGSMAVAGASAASDMARADDHPHAGDHDHSLVPSDLTLRVKALESLLVEKGIVDSAALDAMIDVYENKVGPRNGARVVARAGWTRPGKEKLGFAWRGE